jgi:hypothetical protein
MIKDELQLRRYRKLSPARKAKVDEIIQRHISACAKLGLMPETGTVFREAIDLVLAGDWEPDRQPEAAGPRYRYEVYISPRKEKEAA